MNIYWAYLAGVGGSLCYGLATVLEQIGVKKLKHVKQMQASVFIKFFKQLPYVQGFILDMLGWVFILYAVRSLPLFLIQSLIASSLIVSAVIDHYWLHTSINRVEKFSILTVLVGIILLGVVAHPGPAKPINDFFKWIIILAPILLLFISAIIIKIKAGKMTSTIMAIIAGISFGGTSVASRILSSQHIYLKSSSSLLIIAIAIYGALALFMLSVALQRDKLNRVNSALFASEVAIPSILGLIFLGDKVHNGLYWVIWLGLILVVSGTLSLALDLKE